MCALGQARPKVHVPSLQKNGKHTFWLLDKLGLFKICTGALIMPMVAVLGPLLPNLLLSLEGFAPPEVEEFLPVFCCFCLF
jgi:hypothetical protein